MATYARKKYILFVAQKLTVDQNEVETFLTANLCAYGHNERKPSVGLVHTDLLSFFSTFVPAIERHFEKIYDGTDNEVVKRMLEMIWV